jgi:hypothetical protein
MFDLNVVSNSEVTGPHIGIYRKLIYVYYYENIFFKTILVQNRICRCSQPRHPHLGN